MSNSPLQGKTIRPGSLSGYSYYYSGRSAVSRATPKNPAAKTWGHKLVLAVAVLAALIGLPLLWQRDSGPTTTNPSANPAVASTNLANHCAGNTLDKLVKVSVSQRHMWACEATKTVHDAAVITGMTKQPDTLTPAGTYQIYAKQTDTTLTGTDSTGSWNDPVNYWMPFLDNQYGTYGFHDATWRPGNPFGKIDPASSDASHGCVELSLTDSKWLYNWAQVGTTVTIEN